MHVDVLDITLSLHLASTLMMTGLIWTIQLVHYPLFASVADDAFPLYIREHMRRITWLVAPLMLCEAASAATLVFLLDAGLARTLAIVGLPLLLVIWCSTAFLQAPCHTRLSRGIEHTTLRRLVITNWIRTAAWSVRGLLAIAIPFSVNS